MCEVKHTFSRTDESVGRETPELIIYIEHLNILDDWLPSIFRVKVDNLFLEKNEQKQMAKSNKNDLSVSLLS